MKKSSFVLLLAFFALAFLVVDSTGADDILLRVVGLEKITSNHEERLKVLESMLNITPPDLCSNVLCADSSIICPDNASVSCSNTCTDGLCSNCTPSCVGHDIPPDLCMNVSCSNSTSVCPDGVSVGCVNSCSNGLCSTCTPSCVGHEIKKSIVIFQIDDLQAWWLETESAIVVDGLIQKNVPVTLGVIPSGFSERDGAKGGVVENVKNWTKNYPDLVEAAVHTYNHDDYASWNLAKQTSDIKKGKAEFDKRGIPTWSFVPAYDWGNQYTPQAIVNAGLLVGIDALENPYIDSDKNPMILEDGAFYGGGFSSWDYNTISKLIDDNVNKRGYYIIGFHQQDLQTSTARASFFSFIDKMKAGGKYRFMTAKQYYEYKNGKN